MKHYFIFYWQKGKFDKHWSPSSEVIYTGLHPIAYVQNWNKSMKGVKGSNEKRILQNWQEIADEEYQLLKLQS